MAPGQGSILLDGRDMTFGAGENKGSDEEEHDGSEDDDTFNRGGKAPDFGFREEDHEQTLQCLSLLDRERYAELLKQKHKIDTIKAELHAKWLEDDGSDVKQSRSSAWNVNRRFNHVVSQAELDESREEVLEKRRSNVFAQEAD